jgi:hypothetical protein
MKPRVRGVRSDCIVLTDEQIESIVQMAANEWSEIQIARTLLADVVKPQCQIGSIGRTWRRLKERDERVNEALEIGEAMGETFWMQKLRKLADTQVAAAIFPLKAKHGWIEGAPPGTMVDQRVQIISLPAADAPAKYMKPRTLMKAMPVEHVAVEAGGAPAEIELTSVEAIAVSEPVAASPKPAVRLSPGGMRDNTPCPSGGRREGLAHSPTHAKIEAFIVDQIAKQAKRS